MRNHNGIADLIVKGAIALVTAAFFIGAYLQFQVTFWLALIAALAVYISLLMLHALMRRSERVDALVSEVSRLESEVARLHGRSPGEATPRAAQRRGAEPAPAVAPRSATPPPPPPVPKAPPAAPASSFELKIPAPSSQAPQSSRESPPTLGAAPPPLSGAPYVPPAKPAAAPAEAQLPPAGSHWPGLADAPQPAHDYWSFRPTKPTLPETGKGKRKDRLPSAAEREADLEAVHGMIKRLADEVNLGADALAQGEPASQESLLRASVDALHTTADTMRAATIKSPAARKAAVPPPVPPPIAPGHSRLSSVAAAVAAGRIDIHLEPIVGLADHQVHHYEIAITPRDELGLALPLPVDDRQLAGTGLLPMLDSARINRAARVCRSLAEARQKQCVFAAVSAESLASDRFLDELATVYRDREAIAGELVLAFTQAEVRAFRATDWSALTDMRDLGFRFALESVTDMDYEFSALRAAGFAFVRIEAPEFLEGLPSARGVMPSSEVCAHLGELGLTVVVGHVDNEETRVVVAERGGALAQGLLFGPALDVSDEGVPGTAAA